MTDLRTLAARMERQADRILERRELHQFEPVAPQGIRCEACGMGRHHPWHEDRDEVDAGEQPEEDAAEMERLANEETP